MLAVGLCIVAFSTFAAAQNAPQKDDDSTTDKVLKVTGKVAVEAGKVAIKLGAASAKASAEQVVVPAAKILWDPILTKVAPKVIEASAKLVGKGIKNGFKLIFKKDKQASDPDPPRSTT